MGSRTARPRPGRHPILTTSPEFKTNARHALADAGLQKALAFSKPQFMARRTAAVANLPEFEQLRDTGQDIKNHALAHLDFYLEAFDVNVQRAGGQVHWCSTAGDARAAVLRIHQEAGAWTVTKGKSMTSEELGINAHLETHGITPVGTDLGEYIIQFRQETPSHIIAPAFHLNWEDWETQFRLSHADLPADRAFAERRDILAEARNKLRGRFLAADVGITSANFLIPETGSSVVVTNEGNGDLTQTLPRVHIALASIEKVVPTLEDATSLVRTLARSATGQDFSVYATFSTGVRRPGDLDGPEEYHVVLADGGRSAIMGTEFQEVPRCIRCAACTNRRPVYGAVGGHAYGWVYPGPMGRVLTPSLVGVDKAEHLPNASVFCGKCESVCPVRIPLPKMVRCWREREFERLLQPGGIRGNLAPWGFFARRPTLCRAETRAVCQAAAGRRLDRRARPAGAGRGHVLRPRAAGRQPMSKEAILGAIRRGLKRGPLPGDQAGMLRARMAQPPRHMVPARSQAPRPEQAALLVRNIEKEFGTVSRVPGGDEVPGAVADDLVGQNLPSSLVIAPHPELRALPWSARPLLVVREGRAEGADLVSLQHGFAGIAETGTLTLRASRVVGAYEDAWDLLRRERRGAAGSFMPRNVMLVTGPSRSADIEQTLELGAHGPRCLHVVPIEDDPAARAA